MNIGSRDKKALTYGGVAVLAIIIVRYAVIPTVRSWSDSQAALAPDQTYVASLRESVRSQEATLEKRNEFAGRLGSLFGPQPAPAKEKDKSPAAASPGPNAPPAPENDASKEAAKPSPDDKATPQEKTAAPADGTAKPAPPDAGKPGAGKVEPPKGEQANAEPAKSGPANAEAPKGEQPKSEPEKPGPPSPEAQKAPAPGSNTLAGYVEQNAKKAGATVKRITPKKASTAFRETKRFRVVTLQVNLECGIQNLVDVLKALEKGEHFVKIDQFQLKRDVASGDKLDVTMDLHSYEAEATS